MINPDIDDLINSKVKNKSYDGISEVATLDSDDLGSENSNVILKRRRNKKRVCNIS